MKTAVIFVALIATCTAMDASKLIEVGMKAQEIYEKCAKDLSAGTIFNLLMWEGHNDKATNCARACFMTEAGAMADKKMNMAKIEGEIDACPWMAAHPAVKATTLKVYKSCGKTADAGADECEVAGKWSQCFKELLINMVMEAASAMLAVIDNMPA